MSLKLSDYELLTSKAVKHFWEVRAISKEKNSQSKNADQGSRGAVTGGKTMDGFLELIHEVVVINGLPSSCVKMKGKKDLTIPGFFRATKNWDVLVVDGANLIAVIEFKSQVGSFGKNINNRCEEALGSGFDFRIACREALLGEEVVPFLGYLMLVEESTDSVRPVVSNSIHFDVQEEFENASYIDRYSLFCAKIVREGLYDRAALISSTESSGMKGDYKEPSGFNSVKSLVSGLAAAVAAYTS